jgi:hypothetical protein
MPAGKKVPDYWDASKRLLADPTRFLDSLLTYDKNNIPEATIRKVRGPGALTSKLSRVRCQQLCGENPLPRSGSACLPNCQLPPALSEPDFTRPSLLPCTRQVETYIALEEFTPEAVSKVSRACTSICMWVRAMHLYNTVALSVAPKRAALAAAQATLDETLADLKAAQDRLAAVEAKIVSLEAAFSEATARKAALAAQVEDCRVKLTRADKLIGGLGGERSRWQVRGKRWERAGLIACDLGGLCALSQRSWPACCSHALAHSRSCAAAPCKLLPRAGHGSQAAVRPVQPGGRHHAVGGRHSLRRPLCAFLSRRPQH